MKEIILATNNAGKIREIKEILKEIKSDIKVVSLKEAGIDIEVEEDKDTFEGNAIKKATEISKMTGKTCIADDSGLCIDALNGFPGVKTARFLGEDATQEERNNYILEQMKNIEKENRKCQAITCIAKVDANGKKQTYIGVLKGYISSESRGSNGFGFDEIFELENGQTLAEITPEEKNKITGRKQALNKLKEDFLNNYTDQ